MSNELMNIHIYIYITIHIFLRIFDDHEEMRNAFEAIVLRYEEERRGIGIAAATCCGKSWQQQRDPA